MNTIVTAGLTQMAGMPQTFTNTGFAEMGLFSAETPLPMLPRQDTGSAGVASTLYQHAKRFMAAGGALFAACAQQVAVAKDYSVQSTPWSLVTEQAYNLSHYLSHHESVAVGAGIALVAGGAGLVALMRNRHTEFCDEEFDFDTQDTTASVQSDVAIDHAQDSIYVNPWFLPSETGELPFDFSEESHAVKPVTVSIAEEIPPAVAVSVQAVDVLQQNPAFYPDFPGYKVLRLIGNGSFSSVYLAENLQTGEQCAIKVLSDSLAKDPHVLAKFYKEAVAYQSIQSDYVVKLFGFVGQSGRSPYMVLEYVAGGNLLQWATAHRDEADYHKKIVAIMLGCAKGISDINQAGLLHRDIKPDNIFMTAGGVPRIGDMGLSKSQAVQTPSIGVGTLVYQSPEQLTTNDIDVRSDLYSLGATMFFALTGKPPYYGTTATHGGNIREKAEWLLTAPQLDPWFVDREVPEPLRRIILKATMRDRTERYQAPEELMEDLRLYLEDEPLKHATPRDVSTGLTQPTLVPLQTIDPYLVATRRRAAPSDPSVKRSRLFNDQGSLAGLNVRHLRRGGSVLSAQQKHGE